MIKPNQVSLLFFNRKFLRLGLCLVTLVWLAGFTAPPAAALATTWYVDVFTGSDGYNCLAPGTACATIDGAVGKAAAGDTIQIAAGTYHEYGIGLSKQLTLDGAGAASTIIDGDALGRIFSTAFDAVVISDVTIQNGQSGTYSGAGIFSNGPVTLRNTILTGNVNDAVGGAIFINAGTFTLEDSQVLDNTSGAGGGIYVSSAGSLTVTRSTLSGNSATSGGGGGGGILFQGSSMTIQDSSLSDNTAVYFGGGLLQYSGTATLDRVTISGNTAVSGAGISLLDGTLNATNLTISGNNAINNYGGIFVGSTTASLTLKNSTVAYNTRTNSTGKGTNGLALISSATASIVNTILAYNQSNNCNSSFPPTTQGNNLSSDSTCGLTGTGDQPGVDPLLAPLADYGGDLQTHALQPDSPAIDAGNNAQCPAVDARGFSRPFDGDGNAASVCDIGAVEAHNQITIADVSITEGNSGTATAAFTVTLSPASASTVSVNYTTQDGTALNGSDYTTASGTLQFTPGQTQKTINVTVAGDVNDELDETFTVLLSSPVNAVLLDASATGTIIDDDGLPTLAIADQVITEGNSGSTAMQFTVTLSPASPSVVTVNYASSNGTAAAGSDYTSTSGTLTFQVGQTSKTITVNVAGDVIDEGASEAFTVQLSSPSGATLADGQATGTITDDDEARLSQTIGPVVVEGNSGTKPMVFTIRLSTPAAFVITVDYDATSSGGSENAIPSVDYVPTSGTLTFQPGDVEETFTVQIIGDTLGEKDESFITMILNGTVPITAAASDGTILNDDAFRIYLPLVVR
jgi:hypothetical protein